MKYTVETTESGCVESLEIKGKTYIKVHKVFEDGHTIQIGENFCEKMEEDNYKEDDLYGIDDLLDNFCAIEFIEISNELELGWENE